MKRILSVVLCGVLMFTALCNGVAPAKVEGEIAIGTTKVLTLLKSMVGLATLDDEMSRIADFNADGYINSRDARTMLVACIKGVTAVEDPQDGFRLSGITDKTGTDRTVTYTVVAPYTDTYTLTGTGTSSIKLTRHGDTIGQGTAGLTVNLNKGAAYSLTVSTSVANKQFTLSCAAAEHYVTLPYDVAEPVDTDGMSTNSNDYYQINSAELNYQKRDGGTYIYSNNPEKILSSSVGKAFMRNTGLTGEVYFTFEHSNQSGSNFYLGYQVKNEGTSDVFVTVTNVGYQTSGDWYGREAWSDFYNTKFTLPSGFDNTGLEFYDYTPRVYQPVTYRLPAGKAFYVIGGTTSDAYNNINVGNTANQAVASYCCANGTVKFDVTGGSVTGTFYCYSRTSQVAAEPSPLGYLYGTYTTEYGTENYGVQYGGYDTHAGVIDNYATWTFNDNIGSGMLPVSYTSYYDGAASTKNTAYAAYDCIDNRKERVFDWVTHLNPNNAEGVTAIGVDMVEFHCIDKNGKSVVIDTKHADATGNPANLGNWMIQYQDHFTLVNQGSKTRNVTVSMKEVGSMAVLVRDSQTGKVIKSVQTTGGSSTYANAQSFVYTITVPAHSIKQITLEYVLLANSYGNVSHFAEIGA